MSTNTETTNETMTRRGHEIYDKNPFIGSAIANTKNGVRKITDKSGNRMMVVDPGTGEVMQNAAGFWYGEEVDRTQFVKLYINGVKAFKDLKAPGTKVFELLYIEMQKQIGKDRVFMSFVEVDKSSYPMSKATYQRGLKELVEKGFVAPSVSQGWFFINPDYLFNGDRLAFVKEYRLKGSKPKPKNRDLFDETPEDAEAKNA